MKESFHMCSEGCVAIATSCTCTGFIIFVLGSRVPILQMWILRLCDTPHAS